MTKVFRASLVGAALFGIVLVTFIALPGTAAAQTRCDYCDEGFGPGEWDYCVLTVQDEACEAGSQPSPFGCMHCMSGDDDQEQEDLVLTVSSDGYLVDRGSSLAPVSGDWLPLVAQGLADPTYLVGSGCGERQKSREVEDLPDNDGGL